MFCSCYFIFYKETENSEHITLKNVCVIEYIAQWEFWQHQVDLSNYESEVSVFTKSKNRVSNLYSFVAAYPYCTFPLCNVLELGISVSVSASEWYR